ncbi:carotenoid oxygenase family protein [Parachlamydia sp. AcF125]|uniref:carotenoid oxygenase family protein n=1 Tax=Parachlamydia sp. AcF125 TaxID=2795736 RepID=UPI001BC8CC9F|nr:carotenoid oxygenase family protein [Parachlamydia sp. AcF125]MBS4168967.1 Carotenoid cleavage oxygenase [Parachlamydia sp. AcF125]
MKFYKFLLVILLLLGEFMVFVSFNKKPKAFDVLAELQEEVANHPLDITGKVPTWLTGTLVRNGPINVTVNGQSNVHWFDGLAMLHAFSFQEGKVRYTNKFLRSDAYRTVFEQGSLDYSGFASDPCRSLFKKLLTFFISPSHPSIQNANVNVAKLAEEYIALTEIPLPVKFDPQTLDTLGVLNYQDQLPKEKCWESAHPHYDGEQKCTFNYLIKFGLTSYYTLYGLMDGSFQRTILAEIPVDEPAYMHSFAVTEKYIILTEFPLVVKPLDLIVKGQAFIKNFTWQPQRGTRFIVLNRQNGDIIGKYVTKPFFAFHHANAFEKDDRLHLDMVTYEDASIITGKSLHVNSDTAPSGNYQSRLERFSLSLKTGEIASEILFPQSNEFPRINEKLDGKPYHYVYLTGFNDKSEDKKELLNGEGLYKLNTVTKEWLKWSENGCSAGEPVFVAAPDAKEEDEGVVLAVVLDHVLRDSFLLILDGKSFKELGRARAPHAIPAGFHGQYFQ